MSAHSLSVYLRMFMNNGSPLLYSESIVEMKTVVNGVTPYQNTNANNSELSSPPPEFGIAWIWETLSDGRRYQGHDGVMPGATNSMLINEKGNVGVIMLTNADVFPDTDLTLKIAKSLNDIRLMLFNCFETSSY